MMGAHTRLGCDSLLLELPIDVLRKVCSMAGTHHLGSKGAWGMCCVKMLCDVWYEDAIWQIDTGQFFCHYCIKKDFMLQGIHINWTTLTTFLLYMSNMRRLGRVLNIKPTKLSAGACHDTVLWRLHDTDPKRTFRVVIIGAFVQFLATGCVTMSLREGFPIRDPL